MNEKENERNPNPQRERARNIFHDIEDDKLNGSDEKSFKQKNHPKRSQD